MAEYCKLSNINWKKRAGRLGFCCRVPGRSLTGILLLLSGLSIFLSGCSPDDGVVEKREISDSRDATPHHHHRRHEETRIEIGKILGRVSEWQSTHWKEEMVAQSLDEWINRFWGRLRNHGGSALGSEVIHTFSSIRLPRWNFTNIQGLPWFRGHPVEGESPSELFHDFVDRLVSWETSGWQLEWSEWRLEDFELATPNNRLPGPAPPVDGRCTAAIRLRLHLLNTAPDSSHEVHRFHRMSVTGLLRTSWILHPDGHTWECETVDASRCTAVAGTGGPLFESILARPVPPVESTGFADPLVIRDRNGDGLPDICLTTRNIVLYNRPDSHFSTAPLVDPRPESTMSNAIMADVDNDGMEDIVGAVAGGLIIHRGMHNGNFDSDGRTAWNSPAPLLNPLAMTAADVDGDGDLDLWIGQYKIPFHRGQMPTPFDNANDGFDSWLLENDGHGTFSVRRVPALERKSRRRNYSALFVDWDLDGDPDLITSSDFAGVDVFRNEGEWEFTDISDGVVDTSKLFAMGAGISDWNLDGRMDLFAAGMRSHVAARIENNLSTPSPDPDFIHRIRVMNFGNRLYLSPVESGSHLPWLSDTALSRDVADAGWAWGICSPDINLDGFPDFHLTNGHRSRFNSFDYDNRFWTRDLYLGSSQENRSLHHFFRSEARELAQSGGSYGGFFADRLFCNLGGSEAIEVSWLAGVALERDSRNNVFTDLDLDGDHDLVVLSEPSGRTGAHTLHVFRNSLDQGNWLAISLRKPSGHPFPFGMAVLIEGPGFRTLRPVLSWDSYRCQPDPVIRIGTGHCSGPFTVTLIDGKLNPARFTGLHGNHQHDLRIP